MPVSALSGGRRERQQVNRAALGQGQFPMCRYFHSARRRGHSPAARKGVECENVSHGRRLAVEAAIRLWPGTERQVFPPGLAPPAPAARTGTTSGTWPPPDRRPGCSPSTATATATATATTAAATPSDGPNSPREPAWHGWDTPATSSPSMTYWCGRYPASTCGARIATAVSWER